MSTPTWMGWYDPDKKKPAREKLGDAVNRYLDKTGRAARFCLCSPVDAAELSDVDFVRVDGRAYISRHTYYVGMEPES